LRPEWVDFALEQYLLSSNEDGLRTVLCEYLRPQIRGIETVNKTARQLQRTVGYKSSISRDKLAAIHKRMTAISPDQRTPMRLQLMTESTPFIDDCLVAMMRLAVLGVTGVEIKHIYERLVAKYGDRSMVYRRVRYVLQTLAFMGVVENRDQRWFLVADVKCDCKPVSP